MEGVTMDKQTKNYRVEQIKRVENDDFKYSPTLRIVGGKSGATHCISITKVEYLKICKILTGEI